LLKASYQKKKAKKKINDPDATEEQQNSTRETNRRNKSEGAQVEHFQG
jgi:hypothetical protein